jgi:hypothetical protein
MYISVDNNKKKLVVYRAAELLALVVMMVEKRVDLTNRKVLHSAKDDLDFTTPPAKE